MIKQFIKVNIVPKSKFAETPVLDVSQYDKDLRTLFFDVYNGESLFDIPTGCTVSIRGTKPDNTGFEYQAAYDGSRVTLDAQEQMTIVSGRVNCEIRIVDENLGILGTANFVLNVKRSALSDSTVISDTELPMIEEASRAFFLLDEATTALEESTEALEDSTQAIADVEAIRSELQGYVSSASASATSAEESATNASEAEANALQYAQNAGGSASNAATSETNALNSANSASASATLASQKASEASASATTATNKASEASASATTATNKASEASASASSASQSETNAQNYASSASQSATNASQSETNAQESSEDAEAWAVGQRNGVDVPVTDPTYNNNAKYYASISGDGAAKIYGIKRELASSSSAWTRANESEGKVANATLDGSSVENDFDAIYPWSHIISVNMANDGTINAQYGDLNFAFDGSNGEVMTYIPPFYWNRWQDDTYEYIQISASRFSNSKYSEGFYVGRYTTSNGTHSYSGVESQVNTTITNFRTQAQAKGNGWGQMDYHYFLLQMLYLVEYADNNSQTKLGQGVSTVRYVATDTAVVAESSVNRIIIANDNSNYVVGTYINIGTTQGGTQICSMRKITSKETVTDGTAIYFDGGPVNIAVGNVLWGGQQLLGQCDSLGMKSGALINDGKHSMIYRGMENFFGNIYQFIDGLNTNEHQSYICYDPSEYLIDKWDDGYTALSYVNADTNGYPKTMGYDQNNPMVMLPVEIGASASTYYTDYYYQSTGKRVAFVGGGFSFGAYDGCFYWYLSSGFGGTDISVGSRLLYKTVQ